MEEEIQQLRWELAGLASTLNNFYGLRLIKVFNRYRLVRERISFFFRHQLSNLWKEIKTEINLSNKNPNRYDVLFFPMGDWSWRYQRPQHFAEIWAKSGHRVFYFAPDFRPNVNPTFENDISKKNYSIKFVNENICEIHLGGHWRLTPIGDRTTQFDIENLTEIIQRIKFDFNITTAIIFTELPFWTHLVFELRNRFGWPVVYDCVDRLYGLFPNSHAMLAEEHFLVSNSDLVVATARLIQNDFSHLNNNIILVPNGADIQHFSKVTNHRNNEVEKKYELTICYFGNLAPWFDKDLIYQLAKKNQDWHFLLIGSGKLDISELNELKNIRFAGEIPYDDLPTYLNEVDVCIIPFKVSPLIAATDPVKFYEYLAAGKPVVSTDLPELHPHEMYYHIARNADEFEKAILNAYENNNIEEQNRRRIFAEKHSWKSRFNVLYSEIDGILNKRNNRAILNGLKNRQNSMKELEYPYIQSISPSEIRVEFLNAVQWNKEIIVTGRNFNRDCLVLLDEEPLISNFVSENQLNADVSFLGLNKYPGCRMVSVIDQETWKQSNRRLFLIKNC